MRDELTVILDEGDFIEAYRPIPRAKRHARLALLFAVILSFVIVALVVSFPEARWAFSNSPVVIGLAGAAIFAAALLIGVLLAAPAFRRRAARSSLNDHPGMQDPVQYAFDDEHFTVSSTYTQASYPWEQLWDWRETNRVIVVMPTPRNFYLIPKRDADPALLDRLRENLAEARKRENAA